MRRGSIHTVALYNPLTTFPIEKIKIYQKLRGTVSLEWIHLNRISPYCEERVILAAGVMTDDANANRILA